MDEWLRLLLPGLFGAVLGYLLKFYLDKKAQITTRNAEFKREGYSELISLLLRVLSSTQLGDMSKKALIEKINSSYEKCILYASPKVINAYGDVMQHLYINQGNDNKETTSVLMYKITKLFSAMRNDIGLSNKALGIDAVKLMRVKLNDYSDYFSDEGKAR